MAKNKNVYYIVAVVVVVIIAVFLLRKPAEEPAPAPVVVPEPEPVVEEPALPEPIEPTEYIGEDELIASAACVDGKVSGLITNVGTDAATLGKDITIQIRGLVVKEPGCDATELTPGQSTACTTLNGMFPVIPGENEILVRQVGAKEVKATVVCE